MRYGYLPRTIKRTHSGVSAGHPSAQTTCVLSRARGHPETQPLSWRHISFGEAFQPAACAGGHARVSELRKVRGRAPLPLPHHLVAGVHPARTPLELASRMECGCGSRP
eukprot:3023301-Prymnesium_polylepis.1